MRGRGLYMLAGGSLLSSFAALTIVLNPSGIFDPPTQRGTAVTLAKPEIIESSKSKGTALDRKVPEAN